MLQSMTAFGQAVFETDHETYTWQIRSVNHRHLDLTVRVPEHLRFLEADVRETLGSQLHRGKVEVTLKITGITGVGDVPASRAGSQLVINEDLLQQLSEAVDRVQAVRIDAGRCDPLALLQWPGIVETRTRFDEELPQLALESLGVALADLIDFRQREGGSIALMLNARADKFAALLTSLRNERPAVVESQRQRLLAKLAQLDLEHDAGRLEQELVYTAQRLDIDEELDRLDAHLTELALVFERCEPVGRRLDFLMQELNREANTIASKSADTQTTAISIDMKVLIEQMREQIQNIE